MSATIGLVLDCTEPARLATFWSAALGYVNAGSAGNYAVLLAPDGDGLKLLLQAVAEHKTTKNRVHFDIETPTSTPRSTASKPSAPGASKPTRVSSTAPTGSSWQTPKATSSASATAVPPRETPEIPPSRTATATGGRTGD